MAQLTREGLKEKYNDADDGLYKANTTKAINSERVRTNVEDEADSALFWEDVIDEDNFETDSATRPPSQQSAKVYADAIVGVGTTSGTNAYTVNVGSPKTILSSGNLYALRFAAASTGAATLDVQSSGAKKIFKDASTQAGNGDIPLNCILLLMYHASLDGGSGGYMIMGLPTSDAVDHFKGVYASEGALASAYPTAEEGDYAFVDTGSVDASLYIWDDTDTVWVESGVTTVVPDASETVKGIAEILTQAETNTGTDDSRIATIVKIRNRDGAVAALSDGGTVDITSDKWTLATSASSRTFTISHAGEEQNGVITLSGTTLTLTFPSGTLCLGDLGASGDNTVAVSAVSGDKIFVSTYKMGSERYAVVRNFRQ